MSSLHRKLVKKISMKFPTFKEEAERIKTGKPTVNRDLSRIKTRIKTRKSTGKPTVKRNSSAVRRDAMKKHDSEVFSVKPPQQTFVSNDDALLKRKRRWPINRSRGKTIGSTVEHYDPQDIIKRSIAKTRRGGKRSKTRKKRKRRKTRKKRKRRRRSRQK